MNNLLEISGGDIAALNDSDLRELIGLLCEADCRLLGLSPSEVTWGGHQDAKDGGLDVVVGITKPIPSSFIPRRKNGFQVKKPDMTASGIIAEMRPNGVLRESIQSLIEDCGSYIIICSTGSTTDKALQDRLKAMRKAVIQESNHNNIYLDFYDRGRIATWVRTHPSLMLWVRNRIGRHIKGWQPYENWSQPGKSLGDYLVDEGMRLYNGIAKDKTKEISIHEGLEKIRQLVAAPRASVRLAGLSGVGKTRFVQALFDEKIGKNALNSSQVFYTDMSNGPEPDPRSFLEQLNAQQTHAVLVVDNCPPELHRRLTEVCTGGRSTSSIITVEYDVKEDLPEETEVFRLEPASEELIFKLVRTRYKYISEVDAKSIAHFSGGNARIAIALPNTIQQGETLSGFKDEELFERLFTQRNSADPYLKRSAELFSLVYSFEGTEINSSSELAILGSLIDKSANDLYRDIAELVDRDLVQSRSVWRAVLPQAIANRLAESALKTIPPKTLDTTFRENASERLVKSFTRRLSFLHDSNEAISLVDAWLEQDGWLKDFRNLTPFGITILENIAPVSPKKVLEGLDRAARHPDFVSQSNSHHRRFVHLLRSLAYESALFSRSVRILCQFALAEEGNDRHNEPRAVLKSLFFLYLSGTQAPIEVRYTVIEELITSLDSSKQELGLLFLETALEAWHFSSHYSFDFGARPRDYGFTPPTTTDVSHWFGFLINKCVDIILSNQTSSRKIKTILANRFRGLWTKAQMHKELQEAAIKIRSMGPWPEGWVEVRTTMFFDKEVSDENLVNLSELLKPVGLVEKIRIYGLASKGTYYEFIEDEDSESPTERWERIDKITFDLALQLAQDDLSLDILIPEIISKEAIRPRMIGRGLARGSKNKVDLLNKIREHYEKVAESSKDVRVLEGFFFEIAQIDPILSCQMLDEILTGSTLSQWLPNFQASVPIDQNGIIRLHKALDWEVSPILAYKVLSYSFIFQTICDHDLAILLLKILSKKGGDDVALMIFYTRIGMNNEYVPNAELISVGREILVSYKYSDDVDKSLMDEHLSKVAKICLVGNDATESTIHIGKRLLEAYNSYQLNNSDFDEYFIVLAQVQPIIFLDIFVESDTLEDYQRQNLFENYLGKNNLALNNISDSTILSWCATKPHVRYERISSLIDTFSYNHGSSQLEWKLITLTILEQVSNVEKILYALSNSIWPRSWSGSHADILQQRLPLLESLFEHANAEVSAWATRVHIDLHVAIVKEREQESERNKWQNESFEW